MIIENEMRKNLDASQRYYLITIYMFFIFYNLSLHLLFGYQIKIKD